MLESVRGYFVDKRWRYNMRVALRLVLLSYCRLFLVTFLYPSVFLPFVGVGDLVRPSSVSCSGGVFNTPSQVSMYLVAGVLNGVGCGD